MAVSVLTMAQASMKPPCLRVSDLREEGRRRRIKKKRKPKRKKIFFLITHHQPAGTNPRDYHIGRDLTEDVPILSALELALGLWVEHEWHTRQRGWTRKSGTGLR